MFEIGMKVKILPNAEYNGRFTGKIGTVKKWYGTANRIGVEFPDEKNTASKEGVFWFKPKNLEAVEAALPIGYMLADALATMRLQEAMTRKPRNTLPFPDIKRVIYSGPKTVVLWADGTKTIVSCGEGETYDHYTGFCAAVVKKLFGSTTHAKKVLGKVIQVQ